MIVARSMDFSGSQRRARMRARYALAASAIVFCLCSAWAFYMDVQRQESSQERAQALARDKARKELEARERLERIREKVISADVRLQLSRAWPPLFEALEGAVSDVRGAAELVSASIQEDSSTPAGSPQSKPQASGLAIAGSAKSIASVFDLYEALLEHGFDRVELLSISALRSASPESPALPSLPGSTQQSPSGASARPFQFQMKLGALKVRAQPASPAASSMGQLTPQENDRAAAQAPMLAASATPAAQMPLASAPKPSAVAAPVPADRKGARK